MLKVVLLIISSYLFFVANSFAHENHIGLINIESTSDTTFCIILKIDTKDIELVSEGKDKLSVLKQNIHFFFNKNLIPLTLENTDFKDGYSWFTFKATYSKQKDSITVINHLLFDIFDNQKYILLIHIGSNTYQSIVDITETTKTFALH